MATAFYTLGGVGGGDEVGEAVLRDVGVVVHEGLQPLRRGGEPRMVQQPLVGLQQRQHLL